jgi:hypothetical protein
MGAGVEDTVEWSLSYKAEKIVNDPIVEEVRAIREAYAAKFGFDLDAICRDLREKQARSGREVVSFCPRFVEQKKADSPIIVHSSSCE